MSEIFHKFLVYPFIIKNNKQLLKNEQYNALILASLNRVREALSTIFQNHSSHLCYLNLVQVGWIRGVISWRSGRSRWPCRWPPILTVAPLYLRTVQRQMPLSGHFILIIHSPWRDKQWLPPVTEVQSAFALAPIKGLFPLFNHSSQVLHKITYGKKVQQQS